MAEYDGGGDVVRLAAHQRSAKEGEPVCVICGRYGEYICDVTDQDVCSVECRDLCRQQRGTVSNEHATNDADHSIATLPVLAVDCDLRRQLGIRIESIGEAIPSHFALWTEFESLPEKLKANVAAYGYLHPTPVQMQACPVVLEGYHVVVTAPTGTGKSAAFLIPVIANMMKQQQELRRTTPLALILAPVRELAMQLEAEAKKLMRGVPHMKTALLVGGLPLPPQLHRIQQGVQLLVGTPGRILDVLVHYESDAGAIRLLLDDVRCCVVDEVDMMVANGFIEAVTMICSQLSDCQFICTSATSSEQVEKTISKLLTSSASFVKVHVGRGHDVNDSGGLEMDSSVDHSIAWVEENAKKKALFELLRSNPTAATLVFVDSRAGADLLADAIQRTCKLPGRAASFHGGKSQDERLQVLEAFVNEDVRVLVSTNVLGRGIDLLTVDCVVVFDAPASLSEYRHLVGRVGRQVAFSLPGENSSRGRSTLYVNKRDSALFDGLAKLFQRTNVRLPDQVYAVLREASSTRRQSVPLAQDEAKRAYAIVNQQDSRATANVVTTTAWDSWKDHTGKHKRPGEPLSSQSSSKRVVR